MIGLVKVARRGNYDRRTTGKRSRGDGKDKMEETTEKMSNLFLLRDASSDKLRGVVEHDVKKQKIEALAEEERRLGSGPKPKQGLRHSISPSQPQGGVQPS